MATKSESASTLMIPAIKTARFQIQIIGRTPLITHRFSEEAQRLLEEAQSGAAKVKKPPRDPEAEFRQACYVLPDGRYGFPAAGVKRAMVTAGQRFAGEKATELYGTFTIPQEMLTIEADTPRMRADRVVIGGMSRVSSIAYRPEFSPWSISFLIEFNAGFITPDQLVNLVRLAGFSVGIGDWRVERKGSFGQFDVGEVKGLS